LIEVTLQLDIMSRNNGHLLSSAFLLLLFERLNEEKTLTYCVLLWQLLTY